MYFHVKLVSDFIWQLIFFSLTLTTLLLRMIQFLLSQQLKHVRRNVQSTCSDHVSIILSQIDLDNPDNSIKLVVKLKKLIP